MAEEKLEQTLLACTMPDTATVKQAEASLQTQLRGKNSVPLLARIVHMSQHLAARQLAAVMLRMKIGLHWIKLSPQDQQMCKQALLESLMREQARPVRQSICHAIAALARHQLVSGPSGWPEILEVIKQATSDQTSPENRELGYFLMSSMTETLGTYLQSSLPDIVQTFTQALATEKDPRVFATVLRASSSMIEFLSDEEEVMLFQPIVGFLLDALASGNFGDDEYSCNAAVQVVELISNLSESSMPVLDPYIVPSCVVLSRLASTTSVNESIRSAAASALSDLLESRTRAISKNKEAYEAALHCCISLCRETAVKSASNENGEDDEEDEDEIAIKDMTEMVVSAYANNLPTKLVVGSLLNTAASLIQNEVNQIDREAGLIALIVASEGIATELVESHGNSFDHLLVMVLSCISQLNQSVGTTRHALYLLSQWAEYLWPLMEPHAPQIIPACVHLASSYHAVINPAANMVLQQFCSAMEEDELAPYIDSICSCELDLFLPERRKTPAMVKSAIETLSYASVASGARFAPHFDRCMHAASPLMNLTGEEYLEVRAHATALMGQLAVVSKACTPEGRTNPFLQFVPELLQKAFEGLEEEEVDLDYRDSVHHLFGNVGIALGTDIEQFLPKILDVLLADCVSDDDDVSKQVVDRDGGASQIPQSLRAIAAEEDGDGDDDDNIEDDGNMKVLTSVREAAADSKASAFSALESLCDVFALSPLPNDVIAKSVLVGRITDIIETCCTIIDEYLHPAVRANAVGTLGSVILLAYKAECPTALAMPASEELQQLASLTLKDAALEQRWLPGRSLAQVVPTTVQLMDEMVMPYLLEAMTCDTGKEVAAKACFVIERLSQLSGCTLLIPHAKSIVDSLITLLQGEAVCQREDERLEAGMDDEQGDRGNDDDDENRRHDEILLDAIVEALANVASVLGREAFMPLLPLALPSLLRRSKPKMPLKDRVSCIGCLSLVLSVTGPGSLDNKSGNKVTHYAVEAVKQQEDTCLRRNGLVLCGVLIENGEKHLNPVATLALLKPIFQQHGGSSKHRRWEIEDDFAVLDNSCALLARIIRSGNLQDDLKYQVVTEFLNYLPLKFDHEEDWIVYATLRPIAETCDTTLLGSILRVCQQAIDDITGKGSSYAFVQLGEVVVSRIGQNNVPGDFLQKLIAKKQQL